MNAFTRLKQQLQSIPIQQIIQVAAVQQKAVIEDMNAEQLEQGKTAAGHDISPEYANSAYAAKKQFMNSKPKPNVPDLKLTGAFHRSITAHFDATGITLHATDPKAEALQEKYSSSIIGLSDESIADLQHGYIAPEAQDLILNYLAPWRK